MTDPEKLEAVQAVVDRVGAYQDGAPEGTVEGELRKGAGEAGIELSDDEITRLAEAIEKNDGRVEATDVLG